MMTTAFITGISGQDGSYLAELLLNKGYQVHGMVRRNSVLETSVNIEHIKHRIQLHQGDVTDGANLCNLIRDIRPREVYNLAAQSHVHTSFGVPEYTAETNSMGVLKLLEAVRHMHDQGHDVRFYQAGTSEMFGKVQQTPQCETTPFYPRSPYGVSKLFAHWMCVNYRESYHMHVSNGILFNHESARRGMQFVTRKITYQTARWVRGLQPTVQLGNLMAQRDWGHARDFVQGMWLMLQQPRPDDYVLAQGECHTVQHFCDQVAAWHGIELIWQGSGLNMQAMCARTNQVLYESNPKYYRPCEVDVLQGDARKAAQMLGWRPQTTLHELIDEMCAHDWRLVCEQEKNS